MPETHRILLFAGVLVVLLLWETVRPFMGLFERSARDRVRHGTRNFVIALLNALMVAGVFVGLWTLAATLSRAWGVGLLHQFSLPGYAHALVAVVLLDFWTYWWHRWNHSIPLLWRFHSVHHSDAQMDVTTAGRFHLGEIFLSSTLRIPIILFVGVRLEDLLIYEASMFAVVQFHHANIGLPGWLDRMLRVLIVTPAMHKVHHSRLQPETDSNFTSMLSVWDRLFGTFRLRPDPRTIEFGLDGTDDRQSVRDLLQSPFRSKSSSQPATPSRPRTPGSNKS